MFGALKRGFRSMASLILVRNVVGELRPKRTLAASCGFLAAARLSCFSYINAMNSYIFSAYVTRLAPLNTNITALIDPSATKDNFDMILHARITYTTINLIFTLTKNFSITF